MPETQSRLVPNRNGVVRTRQGAGNPIVMRVFGDYAATPCRPVSSQFVKALALLLSRKAEAFRLAFGPGAGLEEADRGFEVPGGLAPRIVGCGRAYAPA